MDEGYAVSSAGKAVVVDAFSRETWTFLAREARERFPAVRDLAVQLPDPGTPWEAQGLDPPDYLTKMLEDPRRAAEFTRMLYEVHLPLADQVAELVPCDGPRRMLDVGGGSGVMSYAMLRRHPGLEAVIVDIENVCATGAEIATENGMADRVDFVTSDFVADPLPEGFDVVLYCDVGPYTDELFRKLRRSLTPGGRLVVIGKFGEDTGLAHPSRTHWALLGALSGDCGTRHCSRDIVRMLEAAGFSSVSADDLSPVGSRWASGWTLVIAEV
jgi:SAM-dependent methyltransferase